ncbi:unnamed protein product [Dovyalis caffra]|uniref:Uncharacterized protein n=1 Tax=Dovyalis caffra TaxID=77055 RepID=A0AAV1SN12_9ROSI|nr:unnamed protein product [Dovyalis caffra]
MARSLPRGIIDRDLKPSSNERKNKEAEIYIYYSDNMHLPWPKLTVNKGVALRQDGGEKLKRVPSRRIFTNNDGCGSSLAVRNVIGLSNSNIQGYTSAKDLPSHTKNQALLETKKHIKCKENYA